MTPPTRAHDSSETEGPARLQLPPRDAGEDEEVWTEVDVDAEGATAAANDRDAATAAERSGEEGDDKDGDDNEKDQGDDAGTAPSSSFPSTPKAARKASAGKASSSPSSKSPSPRSSTWIGESLTSPRRRSAPSPSSGGKKKLAVRAGALGGRLSFLSTPLRRGERQDGDAGLEGGTPPESPRQDDPADEERGLLGDDSAAATLSTPTTAATTTAGSWSRAGRTGKIRRPTGDSDVGIEPGAVRVRGINHPGGDESSSKFDDDPVVVVQTSAPAAAANLEAIESGELSLASTGAASSASSSANGRAAQAGAGAGAGAAEEEDPHLGLVAATAVTRDDLEQEVRDRILREAVVAEVAVDAGGPPQEAALDKDAERKRRRCLCLGGLFVIAMVAVVAGTLGVVLGGAETAASGPPRVWTPEELKEYIIGELGTSRGFDMEGFTPAKAAYQLILDGNTFNNVSLGVHLMDAFVMLAFLAGTGGNNGWTRSDRWNEVPDPCDWFGIRCNERGRVSGISLPSNNIEGPFNPDLQYLRDELTYLDFGDNRVGLFKFNLTLLPSLVHLNLSKNGLSAETLESSTKYNLTNLEVLDLSSNRLAGPILPDIVRLSSLRVLHLQNNLLTGPVPSELASLANLTSLWLETNQLSGSIPDELCASNVSASGSPSANVSVDCADVTCLCCGCE
jgi:hypothetical protein